MSPITPSSINCYNNVNLVTQQVNNLPTDLFSHLSDRNPSDFPPEWLPFLTSSPLMAFLPYWLQLYYQKNFSPEDLAYLFSEEAKIRQFLEKAYHSQEYNSREEKVEACALYEKVFCGLVKKAKDFLVNRTAHFAIKAASEKGQALHAGINAVLSLVLESRCIEPAGRSSQNVFLIPNRVVFKLLNKRAREEENLIQDLFQIYIKGGIVPSTIIKQLNWKRWGVALISQNDRKMGHSYSEIKNDHQLTEKLLSYQNRDLKLFYKDWVSEETLSASRGDLSSSIHSSSSCESHSFFEKEEPIFVPLFPNLTVQKVHEKFKTLQWVYKINNHLKFGSFKQLQTDLLKNSDLTDVFPILSYSYISPIEIQMISQVAWKLIMPELYAYKENHTNELGNYLEMTSLNGIQVQPYMQGMLILKDLLSHPTLLGAILKRLGPQEQFKAILTALFQMLDLHENNIGLTPQFNEKTDHFRQLNFLVYYIHSQPPTILQQEHLNFDNLHKAYLSGKIHAETFIAYQDKSVIHSQRLKNLKSLYEALDETRWEWTFFDRDLCMGESNTWQHIYKDKALLTLLPLNSAFLNLDYKDIPLSPDTLAMLENSERDTSLYKDIRRHSTPIRQNLSQETQQQLDKLLNILLQQGCYSLNEMRSFDNDESIQMIKGEFADDLAKGQEPIHKEIWNLLETSLSQVSVYKGDTYESLAKRHQQSIDKLRLLNENQTLIPGKKIKIAYSLQTENRVEERIKIAKQLFPKMTWQQEKAFKERREKIRDYLTNYRSFCLMTENSEEHLSLLKAFTQTSLFSSLERMNLSNIMHNEASFLRQQNSLLFHSFKNHIQQKCAPTLFNVMKIMYPHLADTFELTKIWRDIKAKQNKSYPHNIIGSYLYPLENIIEDILKVYPPDNKFHQFSLKVLDSINKEESTPLFFDFD